MGWEERELIEQGRGEDDWNDSPWSFLSWRLECSFSGGGDDALLLGGLGEITLLVLLCSVELVV